MKYFNGITDIEQAKQHYRILAKQLHPDKGGTVIEFQEMQDEYKKLLLNLQQKYNAVTNMNQSSPENELLSELGKLAKMLIKKQVPQNYLKQKIQRTESHLNKGLLNGIVKILDEL
ncbi:hypothetical protein [Geofilum rubicundum]|uniref:J domain-containing protein n=1 Tax=Geofilum rubicundum JCM 15548 TaxID=1236989 RepID=A0A0E9LQU2_9BACT|nr:hypothetical protein [Geofilum rubicundum]GAO27668.1 hypothetical protein JCM15548_14510 [Geofilum rubicundum JCM 15548]